VCVVARRGGGGGGGHKKDKKKKNQIRTHERKNEKAHFHAKTHCLPHMNISPDINCATEGNKTDSFLRLVCYGDIVLQGWQARAV